MGGGIERNKIKRDLDLRQRENQGVVSFSASSMSVKKCMVKI